MPLTSGLQGGGSVKGGASVGGGGGGQANILLMITAINQASSTLKAVAKDLQGLTKGAEDQYKPLQAAQSNWSKFYDTLKGGIGAVTGVVATLYGLNKAVETFFAVGERGAAFVQTGESFAQMIDYMNVGPEMLKDLQEASKGTISDLQLMSYATTALAGSSGEFGTQLAKALPHVLEIAKAANKANPALGSVDYQFQSLIVGLKRLSPRLIDNTGLQVKLGQAYETLAEKLGKTREELTAEEQQLALLNATLEAGDRLMAQVGGTAESLTDPFGRLKAETANLGDVLATIFAPAAATSADALANFLGGITKNRKAMVETGAFVKASNDEFAATSATYSEYVSKVIGMTLANGEFDKGMVNIYNKMRQAAVAGKDLNNVWQVLGTKGALATGYGYTQILTSLNLLSKEEYEYQRTAAETLAVEEAMRVAGENSVKAIESEEEAAERLKLEYNELKSSMELVHFAMSGWVTKTGSDYQDKIQGITEDISKYQDELEILTGVRAFSQNQTDQIISISNEMEILTERAAFIKESLDDGLIPKDQAGLAKEELASINEQIDVYSEKLQGITGIPFVTDDQLANIGELVQKIKDSNLALDDQAAALQKTTAQMTYNIAEGMIMDAMQKGLIVDTNNSKSSYDEAMGALIGLGQELNLVDDDTALFQQSVLNATAAVINGTTSSGDWASALGAVTGAVAGAMSETEGLSTALAKLPREIQILIKLTTVGSVPKVGGIHEQGDDGLPGGRQFGGDVYKGRPVIVGEGPGGRGGELFVPPVSGTMLPHSFIDELTRGGMGGTSVVVNFGDVTINDSTDVDVLAYRVAQTISRRNR